MLMARPHRCAQSLARLELQVVLAVLLGRLHFVLDPKLGGIEGVLRDHTVNRVTLRIRAGLPMRAVPRVPGMVARRVG
jgi:hypothetical protein